MDKNTKDVLDALDFIKERMATKADVAEFRLELQNVWEARRDQLSLAR